MAFNFEEDIQEPDNDEISELSTHNYEYNPVTYISPLELPDVVYSNKIAEEWMAFIHDCHIPVKLTLFEGNDDIKATFSDNPFIIYPLLIIESEILGFNGYIELESPDYLIQHSGGDTTGGFTIANTSESIKQLLEYAAFSKAGRTKLGSTEVRNEMFKPLDAITNHEYHKKKGYMDSAERPLVKPKQLVELFEKEPMDKAETCFNDQPINIFQDSNVLMELEDKLLYINSGECAEPFKVDPMLMHLQPQNNPIIIYFLTKELTERLMEEQSQREWVAQMSNRLHTKPVLVFQTENKIIRGHQIFRDRDINGEGDYRGLLRFIGAYEFDEKDIFGRLILKKQKDGNRIEL